jgi:IS30 family transposase
LIDGAARAVDISKRPAIVDVKTRIGDLEMDLIIGKDHEGALLTINDRVTGVLKMAKIESKEAAVIEAKAVELLGDWKPFLQTITTDNGKEFSNHKAIAEKLEIAFFFARPYHSWERGANENLNGLVRQYFPKKSNLTIITEQQVNEVVDKLNNRRQRPTAQKKIWI